jgi:hypothetical protein
VAVLAHSPPLSRQRRPQPSQAHSLQALRRHNLLRCPAYSPVQIQVLHQAALRVRNRRMLQVRFLQFSRPADRRLSPALSRPRSRRQTPRGNQLWYLPRLPAQRPVHGLVRSLRAHRPCNLRASRAASRVQVHPRSPHCSRQASRQALRLGHPLVHRLRYHRFSQWLHPPHSPAINPADSPPPHLRSKEVPRNYLPPSHPPARLPGRQCDPVCVRPSLLSGAAQR